MWNFFEDYKVERPKFKMKVLKENYFKNKCRNSETVYLKEFTEIFLYELGIY